MVHLQKDADLRHEHLLPLLGEVHRRDAFDGDNAAGLKTQTQVKTLYRERTQSSGRTGVQAAFGRAAMMATVPGIFPQWWVGAGCRMTQIHATSISHSYQYLTCAVRWTLCVETVPPRGLGLGV